MTPGTARHRRWMLAAGVSMLVVGRAAAALGPRLRDRLLRGPAGTQRPLAGHDDAARAAAATPVVAGRPRVILVDGLGAAEADASPAWRGLCARGRAFELDVGFPTRSLPVQAALWTGLTQTQLGLYANLPEVDETLPPDAPARRLALPARLPGSVAVAESHPGIAGSFGFALRDPGVPSFATAAGAAVASDAPLVLIHALGVDEAAHRSGPGSDAHRAAIAAADALIDDLVAAAPPSPERPIVLLADHGHIPSGGHGDAEPAVHLARACVAPDPLVGAPAGRAPASIHVIDLARHLAAVTGQSPPPGAVGRPLAIAVRHPDPDATLPRPGVGRWAAAALLLVAGLALSGLALRRLGRGRRLRNLPFWWPLALAVHLAVHGAPTLSSRPRLDLAAALAALVGAVALAWSLRPRALCPASVLAQLALPLAVAAATLVLAGLPQHLLVGVAPPVQPFWTARAIVLTGAAAGALAVSGIALVVGVHRSTCSHPVDP